MIGYSVTDETTGKPLDSTKLSVSAYQPEPEIMQLFARCQNDYNSAWRLQHRPFDEFDGLSLLQRAKVDQETFGAFVGATYIPEQKKWRWRGRKNTARNKLMGILAHMLSSMLYPVVSASNEQNESEKMTAKVMRILVENHLRKAGYEIKFLYMVLSALVNPVVWVKVEYQEAFQRIKEQMKDGSVKITEVIDEFLSGLLLAVRPIDQILIADFFTHDVQKQPYIIEVDRIPWDTARKIWGHHEDFKYVQAGKTRVFLAGQEHMTLYDIEWTEADRNSVQVITCKYRDEDLEIVWVGGVFMGNKINPYNTNPFKHRRLALAGDEWKSMPIYNLAKSGFEPIDPTGRFFYYKSGAFKEYWDDAGQNRMHQLLFDATQLDVFKPSFVTGLANVDSSVIVPGAVVGMPEGGSVTQYSLGPNLVGAMNTLKKEEDDMSESTQDKIMGGVVDPNVTATASIQAQNQARIMLGPFGIMIADLIKNVGELVIDCIVQHTTVGEIDATIPGSLRMKYKSVLIKDKSKGKSNKIVFTDKIVGREMSQKQIDEYEWKLWEDAGEEQNIYHVNPYKFARMKYDLYVDPDLIVNHAIKNNRMRKMAAFQAFSNPLVQPLTNWKNVVDDFVIEEYAEGDPDRYKLQGNVNDVMGSIMMGQQGQEGGVQPQIGGNPMPGTVASLQGTPLIK